MIRIHVVGFTASDFKGYPARDMRQGDATIIDDGKNFEVIDGYCDKGTERLIAALKTRGIKTPYLHISHGHYDHYHGIRKIIRDSYFKPKRLYCYDPSTLGDVSNDVKGEKSTMRAIISEAKAKGIPVTFVKDGDRIVHGEVKFNVYREQTGYKGNSDAYINDGSLVYWFPELSYLTSGDGSQEIGSLCEKRGIKPKFIKIPHHGNNCPRSQARKLKALGTLYCWDNDYSTKLTDFLETGREDCIAVGMKYFSCHGDLNVVFFGGTAVIYKDLKKWTYKCAYRGKTALKGADEPTVRKTLRGSYGSNNTRITNLLNAGYYPLAVQNKVNDVVRIAKGILNGTLDYGKNEARIAKIDRELGKGYGQLVQDYINVLCGVREKV